MEINTEFEHRGKAYKSNWIEGDPLVGFPEGKKLDGVHCICFCGERMVLVKNNKDAWGPPGGYIEPGETYEEAVIRELKEEANMKVLHQECIGYQDVTRKEDGVVFRQVRSFCIVEPYGEFVSDPDGDITEIKLIDPQDYKQYFDWLEIGDRIMERAIEMYEERRIQER